jgi:predicted SAM-dependent methyltransferase
MRLIIGANRRQVPGWTHHDVLDLPGIDIKCDFWDLPKHIEPASCEAIQMTHVLEHFPMKRTREALELVYDLLKEGGKFYIEVPNFYWHAQMIIRNPRDRQIVEYAFGGQIDEYDFHYMGFTPEILEEDLMATGFGIIELLPESSIVCEAEK